MIKVHNLSLIAEDLALKELKNTLEQIGGEYVWENNNDDDSKPIVVINMDSGVENVALDNVYLTKYGEIACHGELTDCCYEDDWHISKVDRGHVKYITGYMDVDIPETPYDKEVNALIDKFMEDLGKINQKYLIR